MVFFEDTFISILNMSIIASYAAIAVIIARLLLKKAPKAFSYALWSVVLFRLICPFSFSSAFSLLGFIQPAQTGTSTNRTAGKEISGYSSSLLALATRKKIPAPGPLAFGESNVKARINNILDYKRPAFWAIFSSIAAVIILTFLLLANPVSGYSIYEHPETFLDQNSLRAPPRCALLTISAATNIY